MGSPMLSRIEIFPVKSLDGLVRQGAMLLPSGALEGDRQYAMFDANGRFINGKANPLIHRIRATFDPDLTAITLKIQDQPQSETFSLRGRSGLEGWLSRYFQQPVTVQENTVTGFPDDLSAPGPTVISTETLCTVAGWFSDLDIAEIRRRFRTNLEVAHTPAFWEDQLYGGDDQGGVLFHIGAVPLVGINPCQRCIVPTRSSVEGQADPTFQRQFVAYRRAQLPSWTDRLRFNHFYKLAVNTRIATDIQGQQLKVGDPVKSGLP